MNAICQVPEQFNEGLLKSGTLSSGGCSGGYAAAQPVHSSKARQFAFL